MEEIIIEFQNITKYPILDFLSRYKDFLINSYPRIDEYYSGRTESIENEHLNELVYLTKQCNEILSLFNNSAKKFNKCGFWQLMDFICDLNETIEKINKLPKFRRTSKTKRGFKSYIQIHTNIGGMKTMEDTSNSIDIRNEQENNWPELMLNNDLNEDDWEIDGLKPITALIDNNNQVVVTTVLDQPIGDRIYGVDIDRNIDFYNNDLKLKEYQENILQKCDILSSLKKGDIPEIPGMGINSQLFNGSSIKQILISELVKEITDSFMQNDLFESLSVSNVSFKDREMMMNLEIKTKYDYKTTKTIPI